MLTMCSKCFPTIQIPANSKRQVLSSGTPSFVSKRSAATAGAVSQALVEIISDPFGRSRTLL